MIAGVDPITAPSFWARMNGMSLVGSAPPRCGASVDASDMLNFTMMPPPEPSGKYV